MTKPKPRVFRKNINGEDVTQVTRSPADAVRFVYDGWREVTAEVDAAAAAAKQTADKAPTKK